MRKGLSREQPNVVSDKCLCGVQVIRTSWNWTCQHCGRVYTNFGSAKTPYLLCIGYIGDYDPLGM